MKAIIIGLFALFAVFSGFSFSTAFGEITPNNAFILEGSGFAVTEETINTSEIDIAISTQRQTGSTIQSTVEDGFVTINDLDFLTTELQATFLREGKYIRISGNVESDSGEEASLRFFGRLVEESKSASIYGFTGRITNGDDSYKIIYTVKLSALSKIVPTTESKTTNEQLTIRILKGSSTQGIGNYINAESLRYFSQDRITIKPGTTITIVNDDVVSHSIKSGSENYGDRYNRYTADDRISTGEILPGKSVTITFDDAGFYRLYDPDYDWMGIVAYVFPNTDSIVLGQGKTGN
ncbi:MAG: hypothetical protein K5793_04590 [Nitrosarchaeum sp.]|nr:hypothetical protein [Nitrosarchaeum sp.]MCV0399370.1 hypothetical protein [Nitrosarchaeum sp.]